MSLEKDKRKTLAYIVGVALGDGNLSNPNGRAIRLRVTCDAKYPKLSQSIITALKSLLPDNAVSIAPGPKDTYYNISVYSNKLAEWMPWQSGKGSKEVQLARVPQWIKDNDQFSKACLRGLFQTDGCIYNDRGYLMVNFTNNITPLVEDVCTMISSCGFTFSHQKLQRGEKVKHTIRIARDSQSFIDGIGLFKK